MPKRFSIFVALIEKLKRMQINITFPDGAVRSYPSGSSAMDVALSISEGLARNVLAAKVDKEVWDASRPITTDVALQLLTWKDKEGQQTYWHSSAHLMAEALEALYPGVKLAIGGSSGVDRAGAQIEDARRACSKKR